MHKYESDLTSKEKRKMEIEKLKQMTFLEKLSHMWSYHKLILFMPIIVILLVFGIVRWVENSRYETVLSIAVVNSASWEDNSEVWEGLREQLEIQNRHSEILVDTAYVFLEDAPNMEATQKLTVVVAAGTLDILIANQHVYDTYRVHDMFLDLGEIFSEEEMAAMQIVNGNAIDISATTEVNERYFGVMHTPVYLTVISNVDLDEVNLEGITKRELIRRFYQALWED